MSYVDLSPVHYTPQIISSSLVADLNADQSQQATLEEELSSGVIINQPSDNPAGAARMMQLGASLARAQQWSVNANDGLGWLSTANSTVNNMISAVQQARSSVAALSGELIGNSQGAITGTIATLQSTMQSLTQMANTTYAGQAIFAGTGNATAAYDQNGNYLGAGSAPTRTVGPGVTVPISLTGPQLLGTGTSGLLGPSGVLGQLVTDLRTGTPASLQQAGTTDLSNLDAAIANLTGQAGSLGAAYQRMQTFAAQATTTQTALQSQMGSIDNVDVAQASTQLSEAQQTYQSGLWATSQIEEHSLLNYLA